MIKLFNNKEIKKLIYMKKIAIYVIQSLNSRIINIDI